MTKRPALAGALNDWKLYLFVIPALVMVGIFAYVPATMAVYYSFFDWRGGASATYLGLGNYARLLQDRVLWASFGTIARAIASSSHIHWNTPVSNSAVGVSALYSSSLAGPLPS